MGHGYNGEHFFSAEWAAMMGWTHATGEDLISKSDFAHNTPAWYVYHYLPWLLQNTFYQSANELG